MLSSQLSFGPFEDDVNFVVTGRSDFDFRTLDNTVVVSFCMSIRVPRDLLDNDYQRYRRH